jgi:predicted nucleotidyltransferase
LARLHRRPGHGIGHAGRRGATRAQRGNVAALEFRTMRISTQARDAIVRTTSELAGAGARVHLFGSRLHDHLRGGDIDLLVECPQSVVRPVWLAAQITARLQRTLGERKIDVLLIDPSTVLEPVHRVARAEGVELTLGPVGAAG